MPLYQWVRNNVALSFFFTTEIICLFYGFAFLISSFGKDDQKLTSTSPPLLVITEQAYQDLVHLELAEFAHLPVSDSNVVITSREQAIDAFAKNEHAILILSRPLDAQEMIALKIKSDRLPIRQDVIDNSVAANANLPVFIRDNTSSKVEDRLAAFLGNNQIQDGIFQKFQQKSLKSSFRNG